MVENGIYKNLTVYDLQGMCLVEDDISSSDVKGLLTVCFFLNYNI